MKSEQRHKLQTNVLADRTGQAIQQARPYMGKVLLGIVAAIVALSGWGVWYTMDQKKNAEAWKNFFFANGDPDQLMEVYRETPSGAAALWARQSEANANLANALVKVYDDREEAEELLQQAKKGFETVLKEASDPLLKCRATLGLAQALESLSEEDEAIAQYRNLLKMPGVEANLVTEIQTRLDWLESADGKSFFAWYKDFKPSPAKPLNISPDAPLPDAPDMKLPEVTPVKTEPTPGSLPSLDPPPPAEPKLEEAKPTESAKPAESTDAGQSTSPATPSSSGGEPTSGSGG